MLTYFKNERVKLHRCSFMTSLFVIGLINNTGYVMVSAGAESLAKDFGKENLMPLFAM